MDKKTKAKWLKALRSGKYEQGRGRLQRVEDGSRQYCCLGVLCEVLGYTHSGDGQGYYDQRGNYISASLATYDIEALGLDKKVRFEKTETELQPKLIDLNDDRKWNFNQIANYLEKVNF